MKIQPLKVYKVGKCFLNSKTYPIQSKLASRNRYIIKKWIEDSKKNNYTLIFADLKTQAERNWNELTAADKSDLSFCKYIESQKTPCFLFVQYLIKHETQLSWADLIWKTDKHFNFKGNKIYADFLESIIRKYD